MGAAASSSEGRRAHFTCVWAIENIFALTVGTSPIFTAKSMEMTKWTLRLNISPSDIILRVYREEEEDGPEKIAIDYELSFLGTDGLPLIKRTGTYTFFRGRHGGLQNFAKKVDVFARRRAEFLPRDVLTIRCRMWKKGDETPKSDVCFARTRMGMDWHCFVWAIKDFSTLPLRHKMTRLLKSNSEGAPELTLILCLRKYFGIINVCIDIDCGDMTKSCAVTGKISLLDAEGAAVDSVKLYRYLSRRHINLCSKFFVKQKLPTLKTTLLPNDVLSLRCEFEILHGIVWSRVENGAELESVIDTDVRKRQIKEIVESATASCPFRQNVREFFEDETLSDVSLRADTETFPVHKIILSSSSPVFEAMFTNDMKEKTSECIDVRDVDAGTFRRLLLYIYTNEVPEVEWDKAADLFRAADKYELLELKKQCSAILKWNISRSNVCCILSLADMHHDEYLRKAVLDYISKNLDIFNSKIWKLFKKGNSGLAMETMERIVYNVADSNQRI
ncbi:Speckle-type POZ protein-like B [Araneus ventricosus]|uniref:Speckle-type POZ protein-like B n=1 Tax=Araneus ventricosus TaxID=182803 RepID=A0A4Y2KWC3_ARAVE|nr:Speckle-type POZ protein-like B [Araneus ventricosus]